jgi:phosphocarrier protein HPr
MIQESITIQNQLGLHTRAAAKLVDIAKRYESKIELVFRNRMIDCKSIMNVITLGAQKDDVLQMIITGNDEQEARQAVLQLVNNKFGED